MKRLVLAAVLLAAGLAHADTGWHLYMYDPGYDPGVLVTTGAGLSVDSGVLSAPTPTRSFNYATRSLNTCFQVSATHDAIVNYAVDVTTTLTLANGAQGTVTLRTYADSSCTTGGQTVTSGTSGLPTTLSVTVGLQATGTVMLVGVVPAGLYARQETANTVGTPTFTARAAQETLL